MNSFQIYLFLLACTCITGLIQWQRVDPVVQWIILLVHFTLFIEASAYYVMHELKQPATFLYHFSSPITLGIWLIYFARRGFPIRWVWVMGGIFVLFHCSTSIWLTLQVSNSPSNALRATFLIGLGIWSMNKIFNDLEEDNLLRIPHFWISLGLLVFYSGSYVYLGLQSWLMKDQMALASWLHYYLLFGLNIIFYSSLLVSFLCQKKI